MWPFARLSCGRYQASFSDYQGPLPTALESTARLSTARKCAVSGCSMPLLPIAVDAVDTLQVLSRWFVLLGEGRVCVYPSARTISMHLPSDYVYPYRCVCGRCSKRPTPRRGRSRQQRPPTPSLRIPEAADAKYTAGGPSQRLGHLTSTSPALIIVVANVPFQPRLTGCPKGTVGHNPTRGVT